MKSKEKPLYSIIQNTAYAIGLAWKHSKLLLILPVVTSLLSLLTSLLQLYIAPVILAQVEQAVPLVQLLGTIALFTLALMACQCAKAYMAQVQHIGHIRLQNALSVAIMRHGCMTAYPNQLDPQFRGKQNDAMGATVGNPNTSIYGVFPQLMSLLSAIAGFVLYLLILQNLKPVLMVTVIVTAVAGYAAGKLASEWEFRHHEESTEIRLKRNYIINLSMANEIPKDLRMFGMRDWLNDIYNGIADVWKGFCRRKECRYLAAKIVDVIMTVTRNAIAYVYLIRMAIDGNLTASQFLLYFSAVTGFTGWITTVLNSTADLHKSSLQICEFRKFFEWPEPFRFDDGRSVDKSDFDLFELTLEDVSYRYPGGEQDIISRMNLTIHPGEKLAIVGLNGAGKTTLIKLLSGLLDPTEGRVLLNGQDIRQFNRRDYYKLFTAVFQDFSRLQATIAQNVAQSLHDIDENRLHHCVEQAGLTAAIAELPQGLDTMLGRTISDNGVELSGGQLQRLMLARALYKDAPILLLDEPTAALDPIAENDIYQKYNVMTHGRTSVYISHRLASTRFCDRIIFLENGSTAEEGNHEELMALGGGYCELFNVQSKYYREGAQENEKLA